MLPADAAQQILGQSVLDLVSEDQSLDALQIVRLQDLVDHPHLSPQLPLSISGLFLAANGRQSPLFPPPIPPFHNKIKAKSFPATAALHRAKGVRGRWVTVQCAGGAGVAVGDNSFIMSHSKSSKAGKKTHKIIFLGDSGVGKTCIIEKFATNRFEEYFNPTIGIDFVSKDIKFKGSVCRLQLWDTAGQEKFKSLVPTYLRDAVCCVFVFDLSKPESLRNLEGWINLFRENKKERAISIICGNKNDLDKNFERETLEQLIEKYQTPYYCVSAKTGSNLDGLFYKVTEMLDKQETDKQRKLKQTFEQEYEHPPPTVESFTRSQTKEGTLSPKDEDDKEKLPLRQGQSAPFNKNCRC